MAIRLALGASPVGLLKLVVGKAMLMVLAWTRSRMGRGTRADARTGELASTIQAPTDPSDVGRRRGVARSSGRSWLATSPPAAPCASIPWSL